VKGEIDKILISGKKTEEEEEKLNYLFLGLRTCVYFRFSIQAIRELSVMQTQVKVTHGRIRHFIVVVVLEEKLKKRQI